MYFSEAKTSNSAHRVICGLTERAEQEQSRKRIFERHQRLPPKPGYLWQVETGYFRTLTLTESGDIKTLGVWGAGDIIGIPLQRNYPFQIESLTNAKASLIPDKSTSGTHCLLSYLQQTEFLLTIQHQTLARERLILLLEWLGDRFGFQCDLGTTIPLRMTHQEISETIGSTRVTVTRMLKGLKDEGFFVWSQQQCVLLRDRPHALNS